MYCCRILIISPLGLGLVHVMVGTILLQQSSIIWSRTEGNFDTKSLEHTCMEAALVEPGERPEPHTQVLRELAATLRDRLYSDFSLLSGTCIPTILT